MLFATAEYAPIVKVGGLSEASSGLVGCLRSLGIEVEVVMPDYGLVELTDVTLDGKVSEITLRRAEYGSVIGREGYPKLIEALQKQIKKLSDK